MDEDVLFLLSEEERMCNTPQSEHLIGETFVKDPLDFLRMRPFSSRWKIMIEGHRLLSNVRNRYHITDGEELIFCLMIETYSWYFRSAEGTECRQRMIEIWERLLAKLPQSTEPIVRRYLKTDKVDFAIGDTWCCPFSLTTTENNWTPKDEESIYEIHLKGNGQTTAKKVYALYNHGEDCGNAEYQVNFPRNTSFYILDIQSMPNGGIKFIMREM